MFVTAIPSIVNLAPSSLCCAILGTATSSLSNQLVYDLYRKAYLLPVVSSGTVDSHRRHYDDSGDNEEGKQVGPPEALEMALLSRRSSRRRRLALSRI